MGCCSGEGVWRDRSIVLATCEQSRRSACARRMIRFFYNLLYPLGLILFLPGQIAKLVRRGNYRYKFGQRLGFYDREVRARLAAHSSTWIHAVSVGEVA